jgi:hypothetical protein
MVETRLMKCPFCKKGEFKILHYPPVLQTKTTHSGAAGSKTVYYYTKEKSDVTSCCSKCGKSQEELKKVLEQGNTKEREKRAIKRLKESGLFVGEIKSRIG